MKKDFFRNQLLIEFDFQDRKVDDFSVTNLNTNEEGIIMATVTSTKKLYPLDVIQKNNQRYRVARVLKPKRASGNKNSQVWWCYEAEVKNVLGFPNRHKIK